MAGWGHGDAGSVSLARPVCKPLTLMDPGTPEGGSWAGLRLQNSQGPLHFIHSLIHSSSHQLRGQPGRLAFPPIFPSDSCWCGASTQTEAPRILTVGGRSSDGSTAALGWACWTQADGPRLTEQPTATGQQGSPAHQPAVSTRNSAQAGAAALDTVCSCWAPASPPVTDG